MSINKESKKSLHRARLVTQILEEDISEGQKLLHRMVQQKRYHQEQLNAELVLQQKLKSKILEMKKQIHHIYSENDSLVRAADKVAQENMLLKSQVYKLEKNNSKVESHHGVTVKQSFSKLIEAVNLSGENFQREKSVVLSCAKDLIDTTSANEFDDYKWRAKISHGRKTFGLRILFEELNFTQDDLKCFFIPTLERIKTKFSSFNLEVKTKTKTEPGSGLVKALDIEIKIQLNRTLKLVENIERT